MGWRAIRANEYSSQLRILVFRESEEGLEFLKPDGSTEVHQDMQHSATYPAFITISARTNLLDPDLVPQIIDAMRDEKFMRVEDARSELAATKRHLEDMRALVWKEHEKPKH